MHVRVERVKERFKISISCGILFHYLFKFFSVPGHFILEVTNMPGTAIVLGLNLTRTFFFKRKLFCFK